MRVAAARTRWRSASSGRRSRRSARACCATGAHASSWNGSRTSTSNAATRTEGVACADRDASGVASAKSMVSAGDMSHFVTTSRPAMGCAVVSTPATV